MPGFLLEPILCKNNPKSAMKTVASLKTSLMHLGCMIDIYIYIYIHMHVCIYIYIYIYMCVCVCIYSCIYVCAYIYIYIYICAFFFTYIYMYIYMYIVGSLNKFPDFFFLGILIDSTHMKLSSPLK